MEAVLVVLVLLDGSHIHGKLSESLVFETKQGILNVVPQDLGSIQMGNHPNNAIKIRGLIKKLGSSNFRDRDLAHIELIKWNHLAQLELVKKSGDAEIDRRCQELLSKINNRPIADYDQLRLWTGQMIGHLKNESISISSESLGKIIVQSEVVRGIYSLRSRKEQSTLLPDKGFLDIDVIEGTRIIIEANGTIDLFPQTPGQYVCGPIGLNGAGRVIAKLHGRDYSYTGPIHLDIERSGTLRLMVQPSQWNCNSSGSYQIRLTIRSKHAED